MCVIDTNKSVLPRDSFVSTINQKVFISVCVKSHVRVYLSVINKKVISRDSAP